VDPDARREAFERFLQEETPAIEDLRTFVGGELRQHLDFSIESLSKLDAFLGNLTRDPEWVSSPLFEPYVDDIRVWLTVRVAYYLAACLRCRYGATWRLEEDPDAPFRGAPVLNVLGLEISPLEIAHSSILRSLPAGLFGAVEELRRHLDDVH
jgi:hypothetical protein